MSGNSMRADSPARHRLLPETAARMAKVDLRKSETEPWRVRVGAIVRRTQVLSGLNLDQFADVLQRDQRQIARWMSGDERAQLDALLSAPQLHAPFLQAFGETTGAIEIVIRTGTR